MFATKIRHHFIVSRKVFSLYLTLRTTMSSEFPTTLKDFGYAFNDAGQMRQLNADDNKITDLPFEFEVSSDSQHNQKRYEALGEVITEHVYQMLVDDVGLHKIYVPSPETDTSSFVFGTKTDFKDTKKLLFLIHGSGVVRAGQWARSLIINQSIDHGTQIPYIKRAIELGYDILVTNTNHRYRIKEDGTRIALDGHETPEAHINFVWEQLIAPALDTIETFGIVAHSYGGVVTLNMAKNHPAAFMEKCFGVAFTDSVHYAGTLSTRMLNWFKMNARNYVTSSKPLNMPLNTRSSDISCYSAGHTKHEWTSWACIDALFPYLEEKYAEFGKDELSDDDESDDESDEEDDGQSDTKKAKNQSDQEKDDESSDEKDDASDTSQSEKGNGNSVQKDNVKEHAKSDEKGDGQRDQGKATQREDL